MSADFASTHLQRGLHLLRVRRYAEAEAAFKEVLRSDPEHDYALHQLAISQWNQPGREKDALASVQQAVRVAPNDSDHHALKAILVGRIHNFDFAMGPANEALRLNPTSTFAWYVRANLHLNARKLPQAEADARKALQHDPDHSGAANVLSHALRMQGRVAENAGQIAGMLARDPEDDDNHAAAGWNAIQAGKYPEAQIHFREALRLNPDSEFARHGLIESFKARSRVYRLYLRWSLWMSSKSKGAQWGIVLGLYAVTRFSALLFNGPYAPVAILILVLYFLFVLWAHIARGIGNFMLVCDRFARHALHRSEKIEAWVVGLCVISSIALGAVGALLDNLEVMLFAGTLLAAAIPLSHTFTNTSRIGRFIFGGLGAFALFAGLTVLASPFLANWIAPSDIADFALIAIVLALLSTWLANFGALRR